MKVTGDRLKAVLETQIQAVTLVDPAGAERHGISPRFAAVVVADGEFVGYGNAGVIERVVSTMAPRRGPFATGRDLAAIATAFPRLPHVEKNRQACLQWKPQPASSGTGHAGGISTVHFG